MLAVNKCESPERARDGRHFAAGLGEPFLSAIPGTASPRSRRGPPGGALLNSEDSRSAARRARSDPAINGFAGTTERREVVVE